MKKIAQGIVRLRKLILTVAVLLLIPSAIGAIATRINYDILTYLPQDLDSMIGEVTLEDDFHLASTGMITVEGLPTNELIAMKKEIEAVPGVTQTFWLKRLEMDEAVEPERYRNSGMLLRLSNGLAVEPILIRKKFLKWQDAHPEFPRIVFHGLRHSSATYQLMISGGDIKAVQGTTGHASADMLVNTYAHIQQSSRVELGKKFESGFYAKPDTSSPQAVPAAGEPTISMTALLELLKDADPEMKAKLRLALLT